MHMLTYKYNFISKAMVPSGLNTDENSAKSSWRNAYYEQMTMV